MSRARDFANLAGSADVGGITGRNIIINGNMAVAQRGTSSTASGNHSVDRYRVDFSNFDQIGVTQSQSTTVPSGKGFSNSLKVAVTTQETTLDANELFIIRQTIEAQNLQHLAYGTSSAKSLTLSFWVRSSLAGKYSVLLYSEDGNRSNTPSFTISSADTWEFVTITIDGDTAGTINNDNGKGLQVTWVLAVGTDWAGTPHTGWGAYSATDDYAFSDQVNFAAQTGEFYITGVQLEVGDVATPFEHESYGSNLQKCQRYFYRIGGDAETAATGTQVGRLASGAMTGPTASVLMRPNPVTMRDAPDVTFDDDVSKYTVMTSRTTNAVTAVGDNQSTVSTIAFGLTCGASSNDGDGAVLRSSRAQSTVSISAEL